MKKSILFILFIGLPFLLSAQKLKKITEKFQGRETIEKEYSVLKKKKYVKHHEYKLYFQNGQIKEVGFYHLNKKNGDWKTYDPQGKLRRIRKYDKGKLLSNDKYGIWREVDTNGKPYFYDYDKKERILPQISIPVKYPPKASEEGISGIVKIHVHLDKKCAVKELKVVQSLRPDFDKEALKGVEKFIKKLQYYEKDCKEFSEIITIEFKAE